MERIWKGNFDLNKLNTLNKNSLGEHLGICFTEIGNDFLKATMPVDQRNKQPFGLLHGGASVALAETVGSVASLCMINRDVFMGVGIEINANHIKSVKEGEVQAICKPIKVGGKLHVWEIKIYDKDMELCTICRFTAMVVPLSR